MSNDLGCVVIADASAVARQLLTICFQRRSDHVLCVATCDEALRAVRSEPSVCVLIADLDLPPNGALPLFEACAALPQPPTVLAIAAGPTPEQTKRAASAGAVAVLGKPVRFSEVLTAIAARRARVFAAAPRAPGGASVSACATDPYTGASQVRWGVTNLSTSGAFLVTQAEIPVATPLSLQLSVEGTPIAVEAEVVRIQPPSWDLAGGIGVRFSVLSGEHRSVIAAYVARRTERGHPTVCSD